MLINKKHYQTIWLDNDDHTVVKVIDQRKLPFILEIAELRSAWDVYVAINDMVVRGAPLIGAAAAFGIYLATLEITSSTSIRDHLTRAANHLVSSRPTAVNLQWAVSYSLAKINPDDTLESVRRTALRAALEICEIENENCRRLGVNGLRLISEIAARKKGQPVNILTHCNAGWLACIDYGTATAPIYLAKEKGIKMHVWADETRPRNQGSKLTAWELQENDVPCTIICDNTGGHLMQHGKVDMVLVGCDRATRNGDVANKIGTYLKALAAYDNNVPFYAVLPSSSIDFSISDGVKEIVVEERDPAEVTNIQGWSDGEIRAVRICPEGAKAANYGFDVTPSRLITGLVTEKGICEASADGLKKLFPEKFV